MAAITSPHLISPEEYIARFVDRNEKPMCEYVDGELQLKPMPTKEHSQVQANIIIYVHRQHDSELQALPELTTRLSSTRFCVPDLAVEELARPIQGRYPGPNDPVYLCVEIKSPPDRIGKLMSKCEEYHSWGVHHCWIIDPERKVAWEYSPEDEEPRRIEEALRAGVIEMPLSEVFRRV